jgi:glycosyltransferase involved in cell wall biosynthesis
MSHDNPLVSVITPVYNGEAYLAECIESVLNQTWNNLDYLIVDNCSSDGTADIIRRYMKLDSRIRVHTNTRTVDVIENHNNAFERISAESSYCKLVQADDWLFEECIERMVLAAQASPSIGVVGSYCLSGKRVRCDEVPFPSAIIPGIDLARNTLLGKTYLFWSPSCLMLRADLVRNRRPFFQSSNLHADVEALYEILQRHDFGFVHQVLTYVRSHDESMTSQDARKKNTQCLSHLQLLARYGPVYLQKEEYRNRQAELLLEYYRTLTARIFEPRSAEYWEYQKTELQNIGHVWSRTRLLRALFSELVSSPRTLARHMKSRMITRTD